MLPSVFDGVLGAFAVTSDPIIIALGLGVGALFVRSMTIYLVEKGTLQELRYLDHGAHWASRCSRAHAPSNPQVGYPRFRNWSFRYRIHRRFNYFLPTSKSVG